MNATRIYDAERALSAARAGAANSSGASTSYRFSLAAAACDAQPLAERAPAMIAAATQRESGGAAGDAGGFPGIPGPAGPVGSVGPPGPAGDGLRFIGTWDNQHVHAKGGIAVWRDNARVCARAGIGSEPGDAEWVVPSRGGAALVDNARLAVAKISGATVGARQRVNLIEGANFAITVADDAENEEVVVTIAALGGGGWGFDRPAAIRRLALRA